MRDQESEKERVSEVEREAGEGSSEGKRERMREPERM